MRQSFKVLSVAMGVGLVASLLVFGEARAQQVDTDSFKKELSGQTVDQDARDQQITEMRQEREQFIKEIRRVENLNAKYTKEIETLREQQASEQQAFEDRLKKMEGRMAENVQPQEKKVISVAQAPSASIDVEKKANEILSKGGDLDPEDEKFKEELARAHYNMGNVYFERGEYQRAVVEYYQAVDLMPYDADAHYNLAFVSGEYIGDQETALKHYQWYLYLKPNAEDKKLVEEKMVAAKLNIRSHVKSRVDLPEATGHMNVSR